MPIERRAWTSQIHKEKVIQEEKIIKSFSKEK